MNFDRLKIFGVQYVSVKHAYHGLGKHLFLLLHPQLLECRNTSEESVTYCISTSFRQHGAEGRCVNAGFELAEQDQTKRGPISKIFHNLQPIWERILQRD